MPDHSPRPFDSKLALVAPASIGGVVAGMLIAAAFLAGRSEPASTPLPSQPSVAPPEAPEPAAPKPLSRDELLSAAAIASSDAASGRAATGLPPAGREFILRIPFGCPGVPAAETTQATANFDPETRTVRLTARPAAWTSTPLVQTLPDAKIIDRAEGFWLPRPWAYSETCPPPVGGPPPATPTPPTSSTLGFASLHQRDDSRVAARGDRPYEFVRRIAADDLATASHSYNLVLEGRLASFPGGHPLRCWVESPNHRPLCLYAVTLSRVSFEDAETKAVLAEWRQD